MTKARKKEENDAEARDIFDDQIAARQAGDVAAGDSAGPALGSPSEQEGPSATARSAAVAGHAAGLEKKKWTPPADPLGFENVKAGGNRVRLLKSEGGAAWVIRFEHNPNLDKGPNGETYSKENPHPVLKMLKDEGFRWGFDGGDGKGGWGKKFAGEPYGVDHIEARRVLQQAADMVGATSEAGRTLD